MNDDRRIDKLLRENLETAKAPLDFTDKIMNQIEAFDTIEEKALSSLLQKNTLETPSINFASSIMHEIEKAPSSVVSTAIISKKAWVFIVASLTVLIVYVLLAPGTDNVASSMISGTMNKVESLLTFDLPGILKSPIFALSVFALSSLFFLDYFMRNRKVSLNI